MGLKASDHTELLVGPDVLRSGSLCAAFRVSVNSALFTDTLRGQAILARGGGASGDKP